MPSIFIDEVEYTYEGQQNLLQFCLDNGVDVPYFCYHPAMSVPTNCRMCLVEVGFPAKDRNTGQLQRNEDGSPVIQWGRKPNTSCNTPLAPDMHVRTQRTSGTIKKAQQGVLEFMLINHPLDCPICDQAGECPLQINTYKFGPEGSRYELEKVHKPKRIELGPRVTLDGERCINCTRCVRFTDEISGSHQLTIMARGEKNYPVAAPGTTFDDAYSMNTIDLCPVGALTSSHFRFKARVWEMNYAPTICTGCSRGCSVDAWVRDNELLRHTPRENQAVNQYWMCDEGRLTVDRFNHERVSGVKLKGDIPVDFASGMAEAANLLTTHRGETLFIASGHSSLETLHAYKAFVQALDPQASIHYVQHEDPSFQDDFLRRADRTPNRKSLELLGFSPILEQDLRARIAEHKLVYLAEDTALATKLADAMADTPFVVQVSNYFPGHANAAVLLPAANHLEGYGTYINVDSVAQLAYPAKQIRQMSPAMWMAMPKSRLDAGGVAVDNWRRPEFIVDALPGWLILSRLAQGMMLDWTGYTDHKDVFADLKAAYAEQLEGVKPRPMNRKETFKHSQLEFAIR